LNSWVSVDLATGVG